MTDLDDRLGLLRADLHSRIVAPPLLAVLDRDSRPRRNQMAAALAAAAVVIAVLTTGALLVRGNRHPDSQLAAPAAATYPSGAHLAPAPSGRYRSVVSADMVDAQHGFALIENCTANVSACGPSTVAATQDGVRGMQHRVPAPADDPLVTIYAGGTVAPSLTALGPRSVFYQAGPKSGYFSSDAGATWISVPPGVNGSVTDIPTGGSLQAGCPTGGSDPCPTVALTVRLPSNGHLVRLVHQPDLAVDSVDAASLADGAWWVSGSKGGLQAVAVSRDQGQTWTSTILPAAAGQYRFTSPVTGAGGHLWALSVGQLPDVKNGLLAVYRSDNNGKSWVSAWTAKPGKQPRSAEGVGIASSIGLTICDENRPRRGWVSADRGVTFTKSVCPAGGAPQWSKAGYLGREGTNLTLSRDGIHWTHTGP